MARRGRKPKPTNLKILAGDRRDRMPRVAAVPKPSLPACPEHLDEDAAKAWARITSTLSDLGLLDRAHEEAISLYCVAYSRWRQATEEMKRGVVIDTDLGGCKANPAAGVVAQAERAMAALLVEFGLTPSSWTRLKNSADQKRDALSDFLSPKKA